MLYGQENMIKGHETYFFPSGFGSKTFFIPHGAGGHLDVFFWYL